MRKNIIIAALLVLALLVIFWLSRSKDGPETDNNNSAQTIPIEDPLDVTNEFYTAWIAAELSTTTNPYEAGLINSALLSTETRTYIENASTTPLASGLHPVLCQMDIPERIGGKTIYHQERAAQILILARGGEVKSPYQAQVDLVAKDGKWQISKITCSQGETGPEREFSFEKEGYLLKSVPPPLDPNYWHLVYEENGVPGHTVPLTFNATSQCLATDGTATVCNPASFIEPTLVLIQADMLETGAVVKNLHFR
ncbi:MAG TPA: hypothetical protein PKA42_03675 [Candidatus Paceibacterota bacterium]|nr:hypothetical protein [Candidatus Paceibacterota bacterium]HMO83239.1 hypothetical protein [Candidatus Paceibacterota bacterium]